MTWKTSPAGQVSPRACSDVSLLTVHLGGELPLRLLPEPALRCGGGGHLLRPGCGLPDAVVSNGPSLKAQPSCPSRSAGAATGGVVQLLGPATHGVWLWRGVSPEESLAHLGPLAQAGLSDSHVLKTQGNPSQS